MNNGKLSGVSRPATYIFFLALQTLAKWFFFLNCDIIFLRQDTVSENVTFLFFSVTLIRIPPLSLLSFLLVVFLDCSFTVHNSNAFTNYVKSSSPSNRSFILSEFIPYTTGSLINSSFNVPKLQFVARSLSSVTYFTCWLSLVPLYSSIERISFHGNVLSRFTIIIELLN